MDTSNFGSRIGFKVNVYRLGHVTQPVKDYIDNDDIV